LIFNNGRGRPDGDYSSVDEIVPPMDAKGRYVRKAGAAFGPTDATWRYVSEPKADFFAGHISGAERLDNGNTLICSGETGVIFEVDAKGETVWKYVSPLVGNVRPPGPPPGLGPGRRAGRDDNRPPSRRGRRSSGRAGERDRPPGPPEGRQRGRRSGRPPFGPPPGGRDRPTAMFRATRLSPDHPGLADRGLTSAATR